jgi:hypothetical protein
MGNRDGRCAGVRREAREGPRRTISSCPIKMLFLLVVLSVYSKQYLPLEFESGGIVGIDDNNRDFSRALVSMPFDREAARFPFHRWFSRIVLPTLSNLMRPQHTQIISVSFLSMSEFPCRQVRKSFARATF